jgi:hypothetical protein
MEKQQPLHVKLFDEYVQLVRIRIAYYHANNGGELSFINSLMITPTCDGMEREDLVLARSCVEDIETLLFDEVAYGEVVRVELDADRELAYTLFAYFYVDGDVDGNRIAIRFEITKDSYTAESMEWTDDELAAMDEKIWQHCILEVQGELSFGTLCMT